MVSNFDMLIRFALACLLGGLIGLERERNRHPAGLRTHILVCIGSTLVLICSLLLFEQFGDLVNMDPARLGAQVISGIGFLGAGTIIKEGVSIKGLTTAASLWAVACIGIAIGAGFYMAAILTTSFVLITLMVFSRFEHIFYTRADKITIKVKVKGDFSKTDELTFRLREMGMEIYKLQYDTLNYEEQVFKIFAKNHKNASLTKIADCIKDYDQIVNVEICD
ncbi:MAG: MgtC/SapB family protein [Bacillota bacterium]